MMELTNGVGADAVCEAVGTAESMLQAVRTVRPGGMVGCVGVPHGVELRSSRAAPKVRCTGGRAPGRRAIHHRRSSSVLKPIQRIGAILMPMSAPSPVDDLLSEDSPVPIGGFRTVHTPDGATVDQVPVGAPRHSHFGLVATVWAAVSVVWTASTVARE
jgi:hypothetical protein